MRRIISIVAALAATILPLSGGVGATPTPSPSAPSGASAPATPASNGGGVSASTAATDPVTQQLAAALAEQAQLDATKSALAAEIAAAKGEQSRLAALVVAGRTAVEDTERQIAAEEQALVTASGHATAAHADAEAARREANTDRDLLTATLRAEYESGDVTIISFLLSSKSFSELMTRIDQASQFGKRIQALSASLNAAEKRAGDAEQAALADEAAARAAATALQQQSQTLKDQISNEQDLISKLSSQSRSAMLEISQIDGQTAAVAQHVADLRISQMDKTISDAEQAAWDEAQYWVQQHLQGLPSTGSPAEVGAIDAELKSSQGRLPSAYLSTATRMVWPAPGTQFSQSYGPSTYSFEPPAFGVAHFHTGIDMSGPMGTPIYAAAAGVVASATAGATGYGNHIVIAVDGRTMTLYGHLQAMLVHPGDVVHQGQLIGLMGSTGNSTGPHVHFEVRVDGTPVNPTPLLPPLPPGASGPPPLPR